MNEADAVRYEVMKQAFRQLFEMSEGLWMKDICHVCSRDGDGTITEWNMCKYPDAGKCTSLPHPAACPSTLLDMVTRQLESSLKTQPHDSFVPRGIVTGCDGHQVNFCIVGSVSTAFLEKVDEQVPQWNNSVYKKL